MIFKYQNYKLFILEVIKLVLEPVNKMSKCITFFLNYTHLLHDSFKVQMMFYEHFLYSNKINHATVIFYLLTLILYLVSIHARNHHAILKTWKL